MAVWPIRVVPREYPAPIWGGFFVSKRRWQE
jgi:hypothetical protein